VTTKKRVVFAAIAMVMALVVPSCALLAADVYLHRKVERLASVNVWGYRGPTAGKKQPGEHRLVVLGGSTAFGYGLTWDEAFPAQLETDLRPLLRGTASVSVVNLGFNAQGAYSFKFTLQDYLNLDYDTAVLYEGYNDLGDAPNEFVGRRESPVFRLTGYYPILHVALREKAMALRSGGDIEAAYLGKTVFNPGLAARTAAGALDGAALVSKSLYDQLDRLSTVPPVAATFADVHVEDLGCAVRWAHYCASVYRAVGFALDHRKRVLVVTQPYVNDRHRTQQAQMRSMLNRYFGGNPNVGYSDLGDAVDRMDASLSYDGMHLTSKGNAVVARRLVAPIAALMPEAFLAPALGDAGSPR
jgi:hypothetical protein